MLTNGAPSLWRSLLTCVVLGAAGLSAMACGSSSTDQAADTEPVLRAFVGRFAEQPALKVALLVGRDSSLAYVCDNHGGSELLRGGARQHGLDGTVDLRADDGATLIASFAAQGAAGTLSLPGQPAARFTAQPANNAAGLYEASAAVAGGRLQGRWIVGNDGEVVGVAKLNGVPVANPALQPTVKVGAATLTPLPVRRIPAPVPLAGRALLDRIPVIDSAYSLPCGDFHVDGIGFTPGAPVDLTVVEQYPANPHDYGPLAEQSITVQSDGGFTVDLKFFVSFQPGVVGNGYDVVARAIEYPASASTEKVVDLAARAC